MTISLNIGQKIYAVSEQTLLNVLRSDSLRQAINSRSWFQQLSDFVSECFHLGGTTHTETISAVFKLLDKSKNGDSYIFQRNVITLAQHAENPEKLLSDLRLTVEP